MNRIKSKENLNPNNNNKATLKNKQPCGVKTRNQSRPLFKQHPNNPQKSTAKTTIVKHQPQTKPQKQQPKIEKKSQHIPAQLYYEQEILTFINSQATNKFKNNKLINQNSIYRLYRTSLLESIYKFCQNFQLKTQTFYLYVYFLDSFMKTDPGRKLSLENNIMASYACFLMAQKYQQIYPPSIAQWLPQSLHQTVYRWEGKVIFALGFKFIHESLYSFFSYWAQKFQLKSQQIQSCQILLQSIVFNYDLMYQYEPQKIAKAVAIVQITDNKKKKNIVSDSYHTFESVYEKNHIVNDIKLHVSKYTDRIQWITVLKK